MEIQPGEAVVVDVTHELTKRESDILPIITQHPTTNSHVTVSKGEGAGDLHIAVGSTLRHQAVRLMPNVQHEGPGEIYEYEITAAHLPGQSIELSWYTSSSESEKHHTSKSKTAGR